MIPIYALACLRNARKTDGEESERDIVVHVDIERTSARLRVDAATNPANLIIIRDEIEGEIIMLISYFIIHIKLIEEDSIIKSFSRIHICNAIFLIRSSVIIFSRIHRYTDVLAIAILICS